jgi:hypothetical protein
MNTHHDDFYGWTQEQARLLKTGQFQQLDIEHLVEELECMGARERRELANRLAVLLAHLLKWQYQPERRGRSWMFTIKTQRFDARTVLQQNPGIRPLLPEILENAYYKARLSAAKQTGREETAFPNVCPWSVAEILEDGFWPE